MTKAVLFDLDGTFADTAPDLGAALNHTRAARGLPPMARILSPAMAQTAAGSRRSRTSATRSPMNSARHS